LKQHLHRLVLLENAPVKCDCQVRTLYKTAPPFDAPYAAVVTNDELMAETFARIVADTNNAPPSPFTPYPKNDEL